MILRSMLQNAMDCILVDISDIFYFLLLGEGKGESEVPGGARVVFY